MGEDRFEAELLDDLELAPVRVEARRPKEPGALAERFLDRVEAAGDLRPDLVFFDLGKARMRERVAAELVTFRDNPLDVVRALADARSDDEEGPAGPMLA